MEYKLKVSLSVTSIRHPPLPTGVEYKNDVETPRGNKASSLCPLWGLSVDTPRTDFFFSTPQMKIKMEI